MKILRRSGTTGGAPLADVAKALGIAGRRLGFDTACVLVGFTHGEAAQILAGCKAWQEHVDQEAAAAHHPPRTHAAPRGTTTNKSAFGGKTKGGGVRIVLGDPLGAAAGEWGGAVVFPPPPPMPIAERMNVLEAVLGRALASRLSPAQVLDAPA